MRSIWFSLIDPSVAEVCATLESAGFHPFPEIVGVFRYPHLDQPGLFIQCEDYQWVERLDLHEEYDELVLAIGGAKPSVYVLVDVSQHIPGDSEVRDIARCLLQSYSGYAFDDFLSYSHAWTLQEIEENASFNGLYFFDYEGHYRLSRQT
ncbi:hypothetical protein [Massilia eburnea]|uniref:hypothetical protein n=1 Tax=Massilia eburnea TaxID=1776165 RepID=UPI003D6A6E09